MGGRWPPVLFRARRCPRTRCAPAAGNQGPRSRPDAAPRETRRHCTRGRTGRRKFICAKRQCHSGQELSGAFRLINSGNAPLTFSLHSSCGACSRLDPAAGTIASGQFQTISVGMRLREFGDQSVQIGIRTNDPEREQLSYQIHARCPAPITASPSTVDFGEIVEGTPRQIKVRLRGIAERPFSDLAAIELVSSNSDVLVVSEQVAGEVAVQVKTASNARRVPLRQYPGQGSPNGGIHFGACHRTYPGCDFRVPRGALLGPEC